MAREFGVNDIVTALGLADAIGDDFEVQNLGKSIGPRYSEAGNRKGDVIEEFDFDEREEYTLELIIKTVPVEGVELILGGPGYGASEPKIVLTQLRVQQVASDFPSLSLTVHRHPGATTSHIERAYTVALPTLDWGITTLLSMATVPDDVIRSTFTASVDHRDRLSRQGEFLIGASTKCRYQEEVELFLNATPSLAANWLADPTRDSKTNEGVATRIYTSHKHIALSLT